MLMSFSFADTNLMAVGQVKRYAPDENRPQEVSIIPDGWFVTVSDTLTGESKTGKWSDQQLHAVVSLAMGSGEDGFISDDMISQLYQIAEPLFEGWPSSVRPIP